MTRSTGARHGDAALAVPADAGHLVVRRSLLQRLADAGDADVIAIWGPAGYGKSTLAAQHARALRERGVPVAWWSVAAADDNATSMLGRLVAALRAGLGDVVPDLSPVLVAQGDDAIPSVVRVIVEAVRRGPGVVLVIDDCGYICDPRAVEVLDSIITRCGEQLQTIVTSRGRPALPLSRHRVAGRLLELGPDDLRMSEGEAQQIVGGAGSGQGSDTVIDGLARYADGWAAGLHLIALSLRSAAGAGQLLAQLRRHQPETISEFLTEQVWGQLSPDRQAFLTAIAITETTCADLANALTGRDDSYRMLVEAERDALFLTRTEAGGDWFRLHPLFRDWLSERAQRDGTTRLSRLHDAAAHWYADHGLLEQALQHAKELGDDRGVRLLEQQSMKLVEDSQMARLIRLAELVGQPQRESSRRLTLSVAWANSLLQRTSAAQAAIEQVSASLHSAPGTPDLVGPAVTGDRDTWREAAVVQAIIDVYRDRTDRLGALVDDALDPTTYRPLLVAVAANTRAVGYLHEFRFDEARSIQAWAREPQNRTQGPFPGVYGRCLSALAAFEQLDTDAAGLYLQEAYALAGERAGPHAYATHLAGALLGELSFWTGQYAQARELLEAAHELGADYGIVEFLRARFGVLAGLRAGDGQVAAAFDLLGEGMQLARRLDLPRLSAELTLVAVELHLREGELAAARQQLDAVAPRGPDGAARVMADQLLRTAECRVLSASGRGAEAVALGQRLLEEMEAQGRPRAALRAQIVLAQALESARRPRQAERTLATALEVIASSGVIGGLPAWDESFSAVAHRATRSGGFDLAELGLASLGPIRAGPSAVREPAAAHERPPAIVAELNEREREIARCLERGLSNRQIAEDLAVSVNTVKWHLKNIFTKLGTSSRLEAVSVLRSAPDARSPMEQ